MTTMFARRFERLVIDDDDVATRFAQTGDPLLGERVGDGQNEAGGGEKAKQMGSPRPLGTFAATRV